MSELRKAYKIEKYKVFSDVKELQDHLKTIKKSDIVTEWNNLAIAHIESLKDEEINHSVYVRLGCVLCNVILHKWFNNDPRSLIKLPDRMCELTEARPELKELYRTTSDIAKGMILGLVETGYILVKG